MLTLLRTIMALDPYIRPGTVWNDTDGAIINAHGAGIVGPHRGRWFWYGSRRCVNCSGTQQDGGIALYSSSDLYSWQFESIVVPVFNCSDDAVIIGKGDYPAPSCKNGNGLDLERPKVVRCGGPSSSGKFVMWVRGTGYGNSPQLLAGNHYNETLQ